MRRILSAPRLAALLLAVAASPLAPSLSAQPTPAAAEARDERVRMYLDCSGFYCESDFYQTEICRSWPTCATAATRRCTCW